MALSVVRKLTPREPARQLWRRVVQEEGLPGADCPVCRRRMLEVKVPLDGDALPLDVCRRCLFVWFDAKELDRLSTREETPPEPVAHATKARRQAALAEVEQVARQAEREEAETWSDFAGPEDAWKWIPGLLGMPVECGVEPVRAVPWVTWGLAALLATVFAFTSADLAAVAERFGLIPADPWRLGGLTLLTSFFLHAGLMHLLGNGYFLLVFGDNVEDFLGRWRYVLLLGAATLGGALGHILLNPQSTVPCIGASGGLSGVIVFYALRFPHARLGILFRYWLFFRWFYMAAWVAMILWLALQLLMTFLQAQGASDVSAAAHLGGAAVGVAAWFVFRDG